MRKMILLTGLVLVIVASACGGAREPTETLAPAPTLIRAAAEPEATPPPKAQFKIIETNWVADISNCGLPSDRWNRPLYMMEEPRFTPGAAFKLELPEHFTAGPVFSWSKVEEDVVERQFPPIITGGQDLYCNFNAWPEKHYLKRRP